MYENNTSMKNKGYLCVALLNNKLSKNKKV